MPEANNWNDKIITEFRANGGRVGGNFEGAPVTLVHHRGRKSGRTYVNPMMYLPDDDNDAMYVFATKAGAPSNPDWYYNLTAAGQGTIHTARRTLPREVAVDSKAKSDRTYNGRRAGTRASPTAPSEANCRHQNHPRAGVEAQFGTRTGPIARRGPQAVQKDLAAREFPWGRREQRPGKMAW